MITTVLAPNPGPMTLDGTNTHVLPGGVVVDPGPADQDHLTRIEQVTTPSLILITHRHQDHCEVAPQASRRWSVPVRAADPGLCLGAAPLADAESIIVGDTVITVVATPGHTDDSVSLLVEQQREPAVLLTGDTVLGRGTTVISHPAGDLGAYLTSLDRLVAIVRDRAVTTILPGHGPTVTDPMARLQAYRAHRRERLDQVRAALAAGATTPDQVVDVVYADIDPAVRPAALQSVAAQLIYLGCQPA